jgi:hypothetical protein
VTMEDQGLQQERRRQIGNRANIAARRDTQQPGAHSVSCTSHHSLEGNNNKNVCVVVTMEDQHMAAEDDADDLDAFEALPLTGIDTGDDEVMEDVHATGVI